MNSKQKLLTILTGTRGKWATITSVEDSYNNSSDPTENYSTTGSIRLRPGIRYGIMKFDLSSIPAGATILNAQLLLTVSTAISVDSIISVYPILAANSDMVFAEMTWNIKKTGTAWAGDTAGDGGSDGGCSVSGTDYNATAIGSVTAIANLNDTQYTIILDKVGINAMFANNYGVVLQHSSAGNSMSIHSVQTVTEAYRPTLKIKYTP